MGLNKIRLLAVAAVMAIIAAAYSPAVGAQVDITLSTGGSASGNPGDRIVIIDEAVDPALVGQSCVETVSAGNNASTHPNNDLIISSGTSTIVIEDVEAGANDVSSSTNDVTLGERITVELEFGEDGLTSGGLVITFECDAPSIPDAEPDPPTPEEPDFTG